MNLLSKTRDKYSHERSVKVWSRCIIFFLILFESCSENPITEESLTNVNIQYFDSYSANSTIYLYWITGRPFYDFPNEPRLPNVKKVSVLVSEQDPNYGYHTILEKKNDGPDSTIIPNLTNGKIYYFRLAIFDSNGTSIGLSRLLMTIPDVIDSSLFLYPANQAESPLYISNISWSPDGKKIAMIKASTFYLPNIFLLEIETSTIMQITNLSGDNYRLSGVSWSPDGKWLSYCYSPSGTAGDVDYRIWVLSPEEKLLKAVTSGRVDFDPAWDSSQNIYFCKGTYEPPNIPEIYKVNIMRPDTYYRITNDLRIRKYTPAVNPKNDLLAYSGEIVNTSRRSLYTISLIDGTSGPLTENQYWSDIQPSWAPDSRNLFFSSTRSGHYEIWALNIETRNFSQITRGLNKGLNRFNAKLSPLDNRLAYLETDMNSKTTLVVR